MSNHQHRPTANASKPPMDPLEAAKVTPPPAPVVAPVAPAPVAPPAPPPRETLPGPPAVVPPPRVPRVEILADRQISLRGQMVWMRKGRVLTPEFAQQHLQTLKDQGVELKVDE